MTTWLYLPAPTWPRRQRDRAREAPSFSFPHFIASVRCTLPRALVTSAWCILSRDYHTLHSIIVLLRPFLFCGLPCFRAHAAGCRATSAVRCRVGNWTPPPGTKTVASLLSAAAVDTRSGEPESTPLAGSFNLPCSKSIGTAPYRTKVASVLQYLPTSHLAILLVEYTPPPFLHPAGL